MKCLTVEAFEKSAAKGEISSRMSKTAFSKSVLEKLRSQEEERLKTDIENSKKPRIRHGAETSPFYLSFRMIRADFIDFLWISAALIFHLLTSVNIYAALALGIVIRIICIIRSHNKPRH